MFAALDWMPTLSTMIGESSRVPTVQDRNDERGASLGLKRAQRDFDKSSIDVVLSPWPGKLGV